MINNYNWPLWIPIPNPTYITENLIKFWGLKINKFSPIVLKCAHSVNGLHCCHSPHDDDDNNGWVFWYCEKYTQAYGWLVRSKVLLQLYWFWEVTHTHTQVWLLTLEPSDVFTYVPTLAKYVQVFHKRKKKKICHNTTNISHKRLICLPLCRPSLRPSSRLGSVEICLTVCMCVEYNAIICILYCLFWPHFKCWQRDSRIPERLYAGWKLSNY